MHRWHPAAALATAAAAGAGVMLAMIAAGVAVLWGLR